MFRQCPDVLLVPVALVLWLVALVLLGASDGLIRPAVLIATRMGSRWLPDRHRTFSRGFRVTPKPWNYLDLPGQGAD
ncbi:MAG: hypothetical protein ACHQU1_09170 [Gemmatimonadales bacterium]